ncbi:ABC transporter permease [Bacillus sp. S/N-304-OC-R1]|uniref:ABC transporter permease n=1 Tax=Bacillus sp. S/N-304-OC-R1 TaxID=2758034 RepID=UPI001C8DFE72|nr:ABC transporter permease [Bacillus sp. S/N-304-OC-R1]MBY0121126.1 ABC transporter permease [Bacillus sp. S/N-304-OC-R1]
MKLMQPFRLFVTGMCILFLLLPIIVTVVSSFTETSYPTFPQKGFSLQWYTKILERPEFITAFLNSIKFAALASFFAVILGTLCSIAIAKYNFYGKTFLISLFTAPLTVPQIVLGVALLIYFTPMGLSGTSVGYVISHIIICVPYIIRFVLTGLSGYDYTIERAAVILGAKPLVVFWKVTLPLIRSAMISGALFSFLISFDNVTLSIFMVSPEVRTLPLELFSRMQDSYDPLIASVSSIVVLITVIFIAILEKVYGVGKLYGSQ